MGILSGLADLGTAGASWYSAVKSAQTADEMTGIERKNLKLQEDAFGYMKGVQQEIWNREDNSVQRRVKDLEAAGLSPLLAAGQGARAGDAIRVSAPQRGIEGLKAKQGAYLTMVGAAADVSRTLAEAEFIRTQSDRAKVETAQGMELHPAKLRQYLADADFLEQTFRYRVEEKMASGLYAEQRERGRALEQEQRAALVALDKVYQDELIDWLASKGKWNNPAILKYKAAEVAWLIREHDYAYYKRMVTASTGSVGYEKALTGLVGAVLDSVGKGLPKK